MFRACLLLIGVLPGVLLELMITRSSNLATNILIERVGASRAQASARSLGAWSSPKTGWIGEVVYHDAAVVYPPGRLSYVLVVLTGGIKEDSVAHNLVADVLRIV